MRRNRSGFTLIEVMVALVIFSVMAAGFSRHVSNQLRQISYLTDKTLATVVATNIMDKLRVGPLPPTGESTQDITMAQKQWHAAVTIAETSTPNLERMDVSVARTDETNGPSGQALVTLIGFVGKY